MVCYELMLLALNAGDWNGFDRLQNDVQRLDREIQRGRIEARRNDGHTATHGTDGKFTGHTTNTGDCFAQLLANELGHYVTAPTETLYANPNGSYRIGRNNTGTMKLFYSRKN